MCYYYRSTSSAFIIGTDTTTSIGTTPSLIDTTGCCGVKIRQAKFSTFKIGYVIAFRKYGVYVNCSNSLSYCSVGLMIQSNDAELGSAQICSFNIINMLSYYIHISW